MSNSQRAQFLYRAAAARLRLGAWLRGAAIFTGTALAVTVALVLVLNHFAFPAAGVADRAHCLLIALGCGGDPRHCSAADPPHARARRAPGRSRQSRARAAAHDISRACRAKADDPFLELLAADTLAAHQDAEAVVARSRQSPLCARRRGAGLPRCAGVDDRRRPRLHGLRRFAAVDRRRRKMPRRSIRIAVTPGNITVRRNSDQLVAAHVTGMQPDKAQLFAHYQSAPGWEPVTMQAAAGLRATEQPINLSLPGCQRTLSTMLPPARWFRRITKCASSTCPPSRTFASPITIRSGLA